MEQETTHTITDDDGNAVTKVMRDKNGRIYAKFIDDRDIRTVDDER